MVIDDSYKKNNKVELTLEQYLQLLYQYKENLRKYDNLIEYLFTKCLYLDKDLDGANQEVKFERYNINEDYMIKLLKEACPERFKIAENCLKQLVEQEEE